MNNAPSWKHFDHKADIGIQGSGPLLEEAFAQAGLALMAVMCHLDLIAQNSSRTLECSGEDSELLFYDFINELIFMVTAQGFAFSGLHVSIQGNLLRATAHGEPLDSHRHQPAVEVKGASFSGLEVFRDSSGQYFARCIVDV